MTARVLRIATRGSELALWQARHVAGLLADRAASAGVEGDIDVEIVTVSTSGDQRLDLPISALGGSGVFVKEVQMAVLDGRADLAVHSAKDLPSSLTTPELVIGAVPERGDHRDGLVGTALADLPTGATIATGSARRRAQLAHLRPDLRFVPIRGNIATRVRRAADADVDAVPVAAVALSRLGLDGELADVLEPDVCLPQVGQGALAVECRSGDDAVLALLAAVEHRPSRRAVDAERSFLARLGGDCDLPVGALARIDDDGRLVVSGLLASHDGRTVLRDEVVGDSPSIGAELAERLLDVGGRAILDDRR